jgi:hypothetical protein
MKLFIKKLILFLLPILIISFPLDFFLSNKLKKDGKLAQGEYPVWNSIFEGKVNSDIVIYGSSAAQVHIDPQIIEDILDIPTYNIGIQGHNFWLQYLRHKLFLKYNRTPKFIIYEVDVNTLDKRKNLYNLEQFLPYMLFNNSIRCYTKSYQGYSFFDYYIPLLRYLGNKSVISPIVKNSILQIDAPPVRIKGFQGVEKEWGDDFEKAKAQMKYYEVKLDTPSINLFEKFLIECKERQINIIFVLTPMYTEAQPFIKNTKEVMSIFENFAVKYSIPFLDYYNDEICKNKEYFYNAMHLNKSGASIFTEKLAGDLKTLLAGPAQEGVAPPSQQHLIK